MDTQTVGSQPSTGPQVAVQDDEPAGDLRQVAAEDALKAVTQTREAINLRVLLELRRRLKSAAEKELSLGAERMRGLRTQLRRAESELRLCARAIETRVQALMKTARRVETAQAQARRTSARLSSLEQEHEDLTHQLASARENAAQLEFSVRAAGSRSSTASRASTHHVRSGTLDAVVLAAAALSNDLSHAVSDQANMRARGRHVIDESDSFAARAEALRACFESTHRALGALSGEINAALDGLSR